MSGLDGGDRALGYGASATVLTGYVKLDDQGVDVGYKTNVLEIADGALPDLEPASLPAKTGFYFGGYFSGSNGAGTQFYDFQGAAQRFFKIKAELR